MPSQKIEEIAVKDLVLWTENPRDPINPKGNDQNIADRAIERDSRKRWSLKNLFSSMGDLYDLSEIPTVVYENKKPIVYDGNRRVLIGKIIHGDVSGFDVSQYQPFYFPEKISCNVCTKEIALKNVLRKHSKSGSWHPLERDIFMHKHMGEEKSIFLKFEYATGLISSNYATGLISSNKELNQGFVKKEIITKSNLNALGFFETEESLRTIHNQTTAKHILEALAEIIMTGQVTTRKNRNLILNVLRSETGIKEIEKDLSQSRRKSSTLQFATPLTPHMPKKRHELFGGDISLQESGVNNTYRDLRKMDKSANRGGFSGDFTMLIRMGLRVLCERAAEDEKQPWGKYLDNNFADAKKNLSEDEKMTLSSQNINTPKNMAKLLNHGAHGNTTANNHEQTIAISLILGQMLKISHGKE